MKTRIAVVLILVFILGIFACGKKSSTSSGIDLLPVDFVKKIAGVYTVLGTSITVYDTTSGAIVDTDIGPNYIFEALGEVAFGTGTAYAEVVTGGGTGTLYWVADEDEAIMYDGMADADPFTYLRSPIREGKDWHANPGADAGDEITAEIVCTDTTLMLMGGVFHDAVVVRLTADDDTVPLRISEEYHFAQDLGFVVSKLVFHTRTNKLIAEIVYELIHMGTGGVPKTTADSKSHPLFEDYREYLPGWSRQ